MTVLSFINMKGGVGKTTIASMVGEYLASYYGYSTLLIDIDPQINLTLSFVSEEQWEKNKNENRTITTLFQDYIDKTFYFDFDKSIFQGVGKLRNKSERLDLLPCTPSLGLVQEKLYEFVQRQGERYDPIEIMKKGIERNLKRYKFVIIDCPPNLGLVSRNGINISDYYLLPVIPNYLSTYGIPELTKEIKYTYGMSVPPLGIIFSKVAGNNNTHKRYISLLELGAKNGKNPLPFNTKIGNSAYLEREAESKAGYPWPNGPTSGQLLGYGDIRNEIENLTKEIIERVQN